MERATGLEPATFNPENDNNSRVMKCQEALKILPNSVTEVEIVSLTILVSLETV